MTSLRVLLRRRRAVAAILLAAALLLRLLVPAGFMPMASGDGVALTICADVAPAHGSMHHGGEHDGAKGRCAFADLALPLVGGADAVPPVAALPVAVATALFFRAAPTRAGVAWLRPPLRGPPISA